MANVTATEQGLVEALNQWTTKQGVVLVQVNPFFFMQVLRDQGLEIVSSSELTKIRYEHRYLRELISTIFKTSTAAKTKMDQLDVKLKELLTDPAESKTQNPKTESKRPPRKV